MFGVEASEAGSVVLPRGGATNNASEMRSIDLYRAADQSKHVTSNTESAQGRHHHIGIPEPQRDINISLCHWIATTPVVPGRHAP